VRPVDWQELVKLCEGEGCVYDRQRGDHYIMTRPGLARPIVIPRKRALTNDIVLGIGRTLGLRRKDLEQRLGRIQRRPASTAAEGA
jgi:predicted RNA binding protein YcfA (HicA-like mRNA interferase family)